MSDWLTDVSALTDQGEPCVLITVVLTRGSVPREAGTRMVVSRNGSSGTIGGGHLEYRAIDMAGALLSDASQPETYSERFPLGASLGQCCGGLVYLLFERLTDCGTPWLDFVRAHDRLSMPVVMVTQLLPDAQKPREISSVRRLVVSETDFVGELAGVQTFAIGHARHRLLSDGGLMKDTVVADNLAENTFLSASSGRDSPSLPSTPLLFETLKAGAFSIHLFGAGHVGRAIVNVLSGLPCRVHWIDNRSNPFPDTLPANVHSVFAEQPEFEIDHVPPSSFVLIMTHSHALDEAICERALQRDDLAYCGLIGSDSKRRNFIRRFVARGVPAQYMARLTCPIGLPGLSGKHPGEIAVAVAAELLRIRELGIQTTADSSSSTLALAEPVAANTCASRIGLNS